MSDEVTQQVAADGLLALRHPEHALVGGAECDLAAGGRGGVAPPRLDELGAHRGGVCLPEEWEGRQEFVLEGEVRTEENQCNTEKDRDKRVNRHTCGILIALYPCGTVIFFDEIFGCESKSQVYAIVLEWLATIAKDKRPSTILYDDACHLVHIIKKIAQVYPNEYTLHFA